MADRIRDAPLDIWGGGLEFLLLANFFFYLRWKTSFFFGDQRPTIFFFYVLSKKFLSYAFPIMYVSIWCFFWSTYFSSISTTNFFFCSHFQQKKKILTFVATSFFLIFNFNLPPPPPPDIKWCVPTWKCSPTRSCVSKSRGTSSSE